MDEFAQAFDSVRKIVVFCRTLEKAEGEITRLVRTNLRDEILALKRQQGKNILTGGVDLSSQLMELDLIDEFHLVVQPIVVGAGRRLFEGQRNNGIKVFHVDKYWNSAPKADNYIASLGQYDSIGRLKFFNINFKENWIGTYGLVLDKTRGTKARYLAPASILLSHLFLVSVILILRSSEWG
jgi:hypothetical protein